jgi:hypothetical protein
MPQYSSTQSNPFNRRTVTATLDTDTNTLTYTTQTPNGQTVTATVPADASTGSAIAVLNSQLLAAGVSTGALGIDGTAVQAASAARRQAAAAQAEAQATGNPVPAAPDATPVSTAISNTATGTTPPSTAATPPPTSSTTVQDVDLPPTLAAQQPFPSTGAVPVDIAPVAVPRAPQIEDQADVADEFDQNPPIEFPADVTEEDPDVAQDRELRQAIAQADIANAYREPEPVPEEFTGYGGASFDEQAALTSALKQQESVNIGPARPLGFTNNARNQSTLQTRVNQPAAADWRVRLKLAAGADYLYKARDAGILAPLASTDGVIFPYTPAIETSYKAKYSAYDLIHSNYRGYFYQNSSVDEISIKGTFTAQDTKEAAYLLAVIHFFRSVTKMFYGQDAQAGTPPPLCYLSGLGQYQFNNHPCLVSTFNYSLPTDVDYIRANGFNNIGLNLENRRNQSSGPGIGGTLGTVVSVVNRLTNSGLANGSMPNRPSPSAVNQNVTNQNSVNSTYVPTKMDISITLLPIQTRNQVSKQFSLKDFANGNQLKGGFW